MTQVIVALAIMAAPCRPPEGVEVARKVVPITAYYIPSEADGWTSEETRPGLPGQLVPRDFWKAVQMNGTGYLKDGRSVVMDGMNFREVDEPVGRWGQIVPMETAAAHPDLFGPGTTVCFPSLGGLTVEITDTGGGLKPSGPIDIFVGTKQAYDAWFEAAPRSALTLSWKGTSE